MDSSLYALIGAFTSACTMKDAERRFVEAGADAVPVKEVDSAG